MVFREANGIGAAHGVVQLMVGIAQVIAVVVTVGQRLRLLVIDGIYLLGLRLTGEVAGVLRTAVKAGVGLVNDFLVVGCSLAANQRGAIEEHTSGICQRSTRVPVIGAINGFQCCAFLEHAAHVLHLADVERAEVDGLQGSA